MKPRAKHKATPKRTAARVKRRVRPAVKRPVARHVEDAIDALMTASARALGLTIAPLWHKSVRFNLQLVLHHAARVEAFSLHDDAEPAPVFHA